MLYVLLSSFFFVVFLLHDLNDLLLNFQASTELQSKSLFLIASNYYFVNIRSQFTNRICGIGNILYKAY